MPPRRKTNSSSKKSNQNQQNSQPSKFGIQHFFDRHSQNTLSQNPKDSSKARSSDPNNPSLSSQNPRTEPKSKPADKVHDFSKLQNSGDGWISNNPSLSTLAPRTEPKSKPAYKVHDFSKLQNSGDGSISGIIDPIRACSEAQNPKITIDSLGKNINSAVQNPKIGSDLLQRNAISTVENPKITTGSRGGNTNSAVQSPTHDTNSGANGLNNVVLAHQNPKTKLIVRTTETKSLSQNTPPENLLAVSVNEEENQSDVSPEICKSVSVKRFKFSPGMLIKQSQDDGGDEVTWKISPVNDRLHAVSKHLPEMVRLQCSPRSPGKLEKWLSSPPLKPAEKSLIFSNWVSSKRFIPHHDVDLHRSDGRANDKNNSPVTNSQSPFITPPSLPYFHDNALLELLDQVEDVISVDESVSKGTEALADVQVRNSDEQSVKTDSSVKSLVIHPSGNVKSETSYLYFLVLEVSEKRGAVNSSAPQCPFKVL
ncbi:DNA helicase [Sarracenia purpurea var. burkii]